MTPETPSRRPWTRSVHACGRSGPSVRSRSWSSPIAPASARARCRVWRTGSVELLLPLALAYRVPLDDLVGAPDVGDPRVRLKPRRVKGRTVLPLTPPGGVQAWKIIIPSTQSTPSPRAHDGYEWLYVLSGRMRLVLGDEDVVLEAGEAVEFDTTRPHWFGSTGEGPAEVLSLFGRPGERIHVRSTSHQK